MRKVIIIFLLFPFILNAQWADQWGGNNNANSNSGTRNGTFNGTYSTTREEGTHSFDFYDFDDNLNVGIQNLGNTFTISARMHVNDNGKSATIASNIVSNDGFRFYFDGTYAGDKKLHLLTGNGTLTLNATSTTVGYFSGTWHTCAVVVNVSTGTATFYFDGVDITDVSSTRTDFETNATLYFGNTAAADYCVYGRLDDIQAYTCALTETQMAAIDATPGSLATCGSTPAGLKSIWVDPISGNDTATITSASNPIKNLVMINSLLTADVDTIWLADTCHYGVLSLSGLYGSSGDHKVIRSWNKYGKNLRIRGVTQFPAFTYSGSNIWSQTGSGLNTATYFNKSFVFGDLTYPMTIMMPFIEIDGVKYNIGRYPNTGVLDIETADLSGYQYFNDNDMSWTTNQFQTYGYARVHSRDWVWSTMQAYSNTGTRINFNPSQYMCTGCGARLINESGSTSMKYFLMGKGTLDQNGEWYLDCGGIPILYIYWTGDLSGSTVYKPTYDSVVYIGNSHYVDLIDVEVEGGWKYGMYIKSSGNVKIEDCASSYAGWAGIFSTSTDSLTIRDCDIYESRSTGICVSKTNKYTIDSNHIWNIGMDNINADYDNASGEGITIRYSYGAGEIKTNNIHDVAQSGIYLTNQSASAYTLLIKDNLVRNYSSKFTDCGGIYIYGYSANYSKIIRNNSFLYCDCEKSSMENTCATGGIYLDERSMYFLVDSNTVEGVNYTLLFNFTIWYDTIRNNKFSRQNVNNTSYVGQAGAYFNNSSESNIYELTFTGNKIFTTKNNSVFTWNDWTSSPQIFHKESSTVNNNTYYSIAGGTNIFRQRVYYSDSTLYNLTNWKTLTGTWEGSSTVDATVYDTLITYVNWTNASHTFNFDALSAVNEAGTPLTGSVTVLAMKTEVVRMSGYVSSDAPVYLTVGYTPSLPASGRIGVRIGTQNYYLRKYGQNWNFKNE
jgi:hypothetical protein